MKHWVFWQHPIDCWHCYPHWFHNSNTNTSSWGYCGIKIKMWSPRRDKNHQLHRQSFSSRLGPLLGQCEISQPQKWKFTQVLLLVVQCKWVVWIGYSRSWICVMKRTVEHAGWLGVSASCYSGLGSHYTPADIATPFIHKDKQTDQPENHVVSTVHPWVILIHMFWNESI